MILLFQGLKAHYKLSVVFSWFDLQFMEKGAKCCLQKVQGLWPILSVQQLPPLLADLPQGDKGSKRASASPLM